MGYDVSGRSLFARGVDLFAAVLAAVAKDNCLGLSAQLAFYLLLALFPALLFMVTMIGFLPIEASMPQLVSALGTVAPREFANLLRDQLDDIAARDSVGLLTVGFAGAFWSSSAGMVAVIEALNRAYRVEEWRPWWKRRIVGVILTFAIGLFTAVSLTLVLVGPDLAARMAGWFGLGPIVTTLWSVLRWPTMLLFVVVGLDIVYNVAPNRRTRWTWVTPGSLVATLLWIASSFLFKAYVSHIGTYNATYGAIGGVIVVMLWLYVTGLSVLVGAELNGVIERSPADRAAWTHRGENR